MNEIAESMIIMNLTFIGNCKIIFQNGKFCITIHESSLPIFDNGLLKCNYSSRDVDSI